MQDRGLKAHSHSSRGQTPSRPSRRDVQQISYGTIHLVRGCSRFKEPEPLMATLRKNDVLAAQEEATTHARTNRKLVS
jgi:hypothetical protein